MFANLLPFLRRSSGSNSADFVENVQVRRRMGRSRAAERWIVLGWALIALKTWGTFWLVEHYAMPFNAWWIVLPTWLAAAVCTWIYWRRS